MTPHGRMKIALIAVFVIQVAVLGKTHQVLGSAVEPVLSIDGLVANPLNITYGEFANLPMVTERVTCTCVGWPPEDVGANAYDVYTYNWTGVRVSVLLSMAGLKAGAVDVVFRASDGYSSGLSLEKALAKDTIIAVKADGVPLTRETGYPFRLVAPCWWGYKWVKFVEHIEVVDYDYKGTWESAGFPDNAEIPECAGEDDDPTWYNPQSIFLAASVTIMLGAATYLFWRNRRG